MLNFGIYLLLHKLLINSTIISINRPNSNYANFAGAIEQIGSATIFRIHLHHNFCDHIWLVLLEGSEGNCELVDPVWRIYLDENSRRRILRGKRVIIKPLKCLFHLAAWICCVCSVCTKQSVKLMCRVLRVFDSPLFS